MACAHSLIRVLQKGGVILEKCLFSCCVQVSRLTRYCVLYSHQLAQKQWTALCCQWISRSSNQFWVLGHWQSCDSISQSLKWWDSLFWPGCLWKYMLWRPHVCASQGLVMLALQTEHSAEVILCLLCTGCLALPALVVSSYWGSSWACFGGWR